jgi:predicted Zn-dependent protease
MIRLTILCFFLAFPSLWGQLEGVTENQLNRESLYIEAIGLAMVEDYEAAITKMKKFASQESTDFAPYYYLAKWSWQSDNLLEGLRQIDRAENLAPSNRDVLDLKMQLLKENFQLDVAAELAKRLWALDSASVSSALEPAKLYLEASNLSGAEEWLAKVFTLVPLKSKAKVEILELHIDVLISMGKMDNAEQKAKLLLSLSPDHLPFLYRLAKVYQAQEDTTKEIEVLQKVSQIHPQAWNAELRLIHLQSNGNVKAYLSGIRPLLKSSMLSVDERVVLVTKELSRYSVTTQDERAALFRSAQTLYRKEPESQAAQSLFIEAAGYHGQWQMVNDLILSQIETKGNQLELNQVLRYIQSLLAFDRYSAVIQWGQDLLLKYPNNGELFLHLAYANTQINEMGEAKYFLNEASRMIRSDAYLQQKAAVIDALISTETSLADQSAWFNKPFDLNAAEKIATLNLLSALEHIPSSLSTEWLNFIITKTDEKESTYLLDMTKAWAYFRAGKLEQAEFKIQSCWNLGCYTHPTAHQLKYKIAIAQGNSEKAETIKTEMEEMGVTLRE